MILAFEFNYISNNGVLEHLLKNIANDFDIKHKIIKDNSIVTLFVEDESERLGQFAEFISASLPLSIFFKSSSVQLVDVMPSEAEKPFTCNVPIAFTPQILSRIKDEQSPFYLSPFGTSTNDSLVLLENSIEKMSANDAQSYDKLYAKIASLIANGENIEIKTQSGNFVLGKVENLREAGLVDDFDVIATDMSVLQKMAVIRENEIKALATLERPAIRVKVNAIYANKNILPTERVKLRLADDLLLCHICERLFAKDIGFIFKTPSKNLTCKLRLDFEKELPFIEPLEISLLENGEIFISKGKSYASKQLVESLEKFEDFAHASFASIMQEHALFDSKSSCFYLSTTHDDKFMHYSKENGMLDLVTFKIPRTFSEVFEQISQLGESGGKMVENYKSAFPETYATALETVIPENAPQNVYTLWKIVSVILGFSKDFDKAAEKLIENAENFGGQKGPKIDHLLVKEEALVSEFNVIKLIRSGMSFKLAGTDDTTMCFGYMESLAYFLSETADFYKENLLNQKIALGGSLFGYRRFTEIACKALKASDTLCFNRELPIDQ